MTQTATLPGDLLTTEQVAEILGFNVQSVRRMIREGRLHAHTPRKREYRIRRSELERLLADKS